MKKPVQPFPPNKFSLQYALEEDATEEFCIYWYRELLNEDYDEQAYAEECLDDEYTAPKKTLYELSLADIIHLVPSGIDHSQVKFRTDWPRMMDWIDYRYVYHKPIDKVAKQAEYDKKMDQYLIYEAEYKKEMAAYDEYVKNVEIKALEEKLAKLRND